MKKTILLIVTGVLLTTTALWASGQQEDKSTLEKIKSQGYFVVGLDDSFPPMGFRDEEGNIAGFDIDLAKKAAETMGVEARFQPVEWSGVILSLNKGDIDLIWNGMTITKERQEKINFSNVYLENRQVIVVQASSPLQSKADLAGKTVGLQMGSSSEKALKSDAATADSLKEVKKYSNNIEALMDLSTGRIDAVVVDEIVGRYYIAKKPGTYKVLQEDFGREAYGIGFRREDKAFLEAINQALKKMNQNGSAAAISQKWFGEDIVVK